MAARILVVDDILPNVKLLEAKLTSEYYDVITATSGKEALEKIESERPDLVLLDIMMPGMDGFEVCKRIKENPDIAHTPVVMVTALTDSEDRVRGLEVGADDFLSKPIDDIALMARVRSLVRLKMAMDEWRVRENTANQLGVVDEQKGIMQQDARDAKILVVEDQDFEKRKIEIALNTDHKDVTIVAKGADAINQVKTENFDLLIISLNLKEEDGLRLSSHLRSNSRTRNTPILMIGRQEDMPRIANGLEMGAHDYILRPLDNNELRARANTQIRRRRFQESLRATYEISLSMALTDSLTGLYNRRYLEVHLQKLLDKNAAERKKLAVLMVDIDHFKDVNDTYGHKVGDEVLKVFADRLRAGLRTIDLVARLGGEEFTVILPDVTPNLAYTVAERLRTSISRHPIPCSVPDGKLSITTSIGGAIVGENTYEIQRALERADTQLYQAKEQGRNCCVFEDVGKIDPVEFRSEQRPTIS